MRPGKDSRSESRILLVTAEQGPKAQGREGTQSITLLGS